MTDTLKCEIARFIFPFIGNLNYNSQNYYKSLVKKYGKKIVMEAIKEERENGSLKDAFCEKP